MKLKLYALRDSKNGIFYSPATGFDDKHIIEYYRNMSLSILKENKEEFVKTKILDSQIFKLGEIDLETGNLENDNNYLANLVDLSDIVEDDDNEI